MFPGLALPAVAHMTAPCACRPSVSVCDLEDRCDGVLADCPATDKVQPPTVVCRWGPTLVFTVPELAAAAAGAP